jgi:hypothetical protein
MGGGAGMERRERSTMGRQPLTSCEPCYCMPGLSNLSNLCCLISMLSAENKTILRHHHKLRRPQNRSHRLLPAARSRQPASEGTHRW